jgi:ribosomal protein S18 acetylase RimI-like enzyme
VVDIEVRQLAVDDWHIWRDVRLRALANAPDAFGSTLSHWSGASEEQWRQRLSSVALNVVAFVGGDAVGQASGDISESDSEVEVISVWVDPDMRGRGVGERLIRCVTEWAARNGRGTVVLHVKRENEHARRLYERLGFRIDGSADADEVRMVSRSA